MPPLSMTGFGRGEAGGEPGWSVEVRTVNHRYLDCRVKLPPAFAALEERVRQRVQEVQERGRVEVSLRRGQGGTQAVRVEVDLDLARGYHQALTGLAQALGLDDRPALMDVASQREVLRLAEEDPDLEAGWKDLVPALDQALEACTAMRAREGANLAADLLRRLERFATLVDQVEAGLPQVMEGRRAALAARLERLLDGVDLDPARLAQEAAILADRCDVTEELVRLRSHIDQMRAFLQDGGPVGRRLDFLMQEFLREANTIASKISNADIAHLTVEMKNEIEKLREQVQNLE